MSRWGKISAKLRSEELYNWVPAKYTFTPNREDVLESRFRVRYSNTCDSYYRDWQDRVDPDSPRILPNWKRALNDWYSVRRVVDEQTGQVYLDKLDGSTEASLKWSFDFGCCGLLVDQVTLRLSYEGTDGAEFTVTLTGDDGQKNARYQKAGEYLTFHELEDSAKLDLSIHVTGEAEQATRLFPQTIMGGVDHPLDLQVTLKPPTGTLDCPRMLVGVMYSTTQAVQVDGRHFKENSSATSGRGFLHIHLVKARGLPLQANQASGARCCFLPDAKKLKCKTATKKGGDPDWNEEFLVVGVKYHEIKRGALEVYVSTKKGDRIGGLRLSVGYKNVVTAQTALLSKILERLTGSAFPQIPSENGLSSEEIETDADSSNLDQERVENLEATNGRTKMAVRKVYRTTTRLSDLKVIVVEDEEEVEVDDLDGLPEEDASFYEGVGSLDVLNIVKRKEDMSTSQTVMATAEGKSSGSLQLDSVDEARQNETLEGISGEANGHMDFAEAVKDSNANITGIQVASGETRPSENTSTSSQMNGHISRENSGDVSRSRKVGRSSVSNETSNSELNHTTQDIVVRNGLVYRGRAQSEIHKGSQDNGTESLRHQNSVNATRKEKERARRSRSLPGPRAPEIRSAVIPEDDFEATLQKNRLLRKALCDVDTRNQGVSSVSVDDHSAESNTGSRKNSRQSTKEQLLSAVRSFGRKISSGKLEASGASRSAEKKKELEKYLEDNIDMQMLDSEGLEIVQWLGVVKKPKQWHYCWHVLRSDMTYIS